MRVLGEEVVIDAAPGVQGPRTVIVINNAVLAIWPQTSHFVSPQSSLDKWREGAVGGQVVRIKRNRCSREESLRWEAAAGNMFGFFFVSLLVFTSGWTSASGISKVFLRSSAGSAWIRVVGFGHPLSTMQKEYIAKCDATLVHVKVINKI